MIEPATIPAPRAVLTLPIADIAIPAERIGYFDPAHAAALGCAFVADRQHTPILVKKNGNAAKLPWTLVAGLHRLRGAEGAGLGTIEAIQAAHAGASREELRRLELSENLDHRQRRPIERAIFMVERARQEEAIDHPGREAETPQRRAARVRWDASITMTDADWRSRTAAALGCSIATLERYQRLHRTIVVELPDLAERLNFHPLGDSLSAMMQIAGFKSETARRAAVEAVLSRPDWPNVQAAIVAAGIRESTGNRVDASRPLAVMMNAWRRMPLAGQRAHVEWLVDEITPGMARDIVAGIEKRGLLR